MPPPVLVDGLLFMVNDGTVVTWGTNAPNLLTVPADASNLVAIAAGGGVSLGVRDTGELTGWGDNSLTLPPGLDFVAVAAGAGHALALRTNGTVIAWGTNDFGQTEVPAGLSNVVAIVAGDYHSLALRGDGKVFAWGRNNVGQTIVWDTLTNVIAVAGGNGQSLALVGDGRPVITIPPQRRRLESGGSTVLQVFATGAGPLAYQWQHEGTNVPGGTNAALLVGMGGNYTVTISNALGSTISPPTKVILVPPALRFDTAPEAIFLAADGLHLRLLGLSGKGPVVVLASTDFVSWTPIFTNPPVTGQLAFVDIGATNLARRFYRAVESATPTTAALRFISPSWTPTPTGTVFRATLTGLLGSGPVMVFGSTNLSNWNVVTTNAPVSGEWPFSHLQSNGPTLYWYRAAEQR